MERKHFLVIGAASRGARYFIKKALLAGHDITALCRASDNESALKRIEENMATTVLSPIKDAPKADETKSGNLKVFSYDIQKEETYIKLLNEYPEINVIVSFVGPTKNTLFNFKLNIYTSTITALVAGMRKSRFVEFYYHSSVGNEGIPGKSKTRLPAHYSWIQNALFSIVVPVFKNLTKSENFLATITPEGLNFVVFRPDALTDVMAKRNFLYTFDRAEYGKKDFDLRDASKFISREDVAEEILRVTTLPLDLRKVYFGHAIYLVDRIIKNGERA